MNELKIYREFKKQNKDASYLITLMNIFNIIEITVKQEVCDEDLLEMADCALFNILSTDCWIDEAASHLALDYKAELEELKKQNKNTKTIQDILTTF